MRKASTSSSGLVQRKRSSRAPRYEDPLVRLHRVGRALERKRKKLGLSATEWLKYLREDLRAKGHPV